MRGKIRNRNGKNLTNGSQVMHMLTVMIVGLAMGSTVIIGKAIGARQFESLNTIRYLRVLDTPLEQIADMLCFYCMQKIALSTPFRYFSVIHRIHRSFSSFVPWTFLRSGPSSASWDVSSVRPASCSSCLPAAQASRGFRSSQSS